MCNVFVTVGYAEITSMYLTVVRKQPLLLTFTCISTGGPVSKVRWIGQVTFLQGGVSELNDPVTATYTHSVNESQVMPGSYICYLYTRGGTSESLRIDGKIISKNCSF